MRKKGLKVANFSYIKLEKFDYLLNKGNLDNQSFQLVFNDYIIE